MIDENEHLKRWRLILGGNQSDGIGVKLDSDSHAMDQALSALYDSDRHGGLGGSAPNVPRWLGDIRKYFSKSVVQVMQRDALERLNLTQMLTEPEMLQAVEPDVHLVATLLSMHGIIPAKTKETARQVVKQVVEQLMRQLEAPMRQAVSGALNRA
ncbi:MAG: hypothetical protein ACF8OB_10130, partial [Phycisphaeraceae bacterium JB051]